MPSFALNINNCHAPTSYVPLVELATFLARVMTYNKCRNELWETA
jgi:hypothetical protein